MDVNKIIKSTISTSKSFNEIAMILSNFMDKELENGRIEFDVFISVHNNIIRPLIAQSNKIIFETSVILIDEIEKDFLLINESVEELKKQLIKIKKTQKIIAIAGAILTSVALVSTFVAAPAVVSALAALGSISSIITSIQEEADVADS